MKDYREWVISALVASVTSVVAWLLSRSKQKADVEATELSNEKMAADIWKSICNDLKGEIDELRHDLKATQRKQYDTEKTVRELQRENEHLRNKISDLQRINANRND